MSSDASAAASSPMTNGTVPTGSHREADASTNPPSPRTLADVCADLNRRVNNFLGAESESEVGRRTQEQTRIAIQVIEQALQDYDFDALSLSYNGGKDCLVLLILYLAVLHTHFTQPTGRRKGDSSTDTTDPPPFPTSIPSIYAKPPDPFPAVTSFVETSTKTYHLSLTHISTNPGTSPTPAKAASHSSPPAQISPDETETSDKTVTFRDAFALYLNQNPHVKAIFVGTRRTDPHGGSLTHFDATDGNWPAFMRVHPVIDWHLSEIWTFLRSPYLASEEDRVQGREHVEYCSMYDEGYTSLGGVGDTLRNPRLKQTLGDGREVWRPAFEMVEDEEERLGRE